MARPLSTLWGQINELDAQKPYANWLTGNIFHFTQFALSWIKFEQEIEPHLCDLNLCHAKEKNHHIPTENFHSEIHQMKNLDTNFNHILRDNYLTQPIIHINRNINSNSIQFSGPISE